jgi:hypothetical protein
MQNDKKIISKIPDSEDKKVDFDQYGFYGEDSKYFTYKIQNIKGRTNYIEEELSNFVGKSRFHLVNGTNNSKRIIQLQRNTGEIYTIEVWSSEMKPESFEVILKSKQCTFYGSAYNLKKIFAHWMDNEKQAEIINILGWNTTDNIYSFANGIYEPDRDKWHKVDEIGIVKTDRKKYFLPAFSESHINNAEYENERKFKYIPGKIGFTEWAELYYHTYGTNGAIAIQYLILSLFWDIVFNQVGFFPFLFLFGAYGTGKTSLTESLLRVFGLDFIGTPINNASQVGLSRTIAGRNNTIYYLKEYTQDSDDSVQDLFLTAYDGSGRTTGIKSNDNRTQVAGVKSALMIDGNSLPTQKSAVLSRMILLYFSNNKFTDKQREAYKSLQQEQDKGVGKVITEILKYRNHFKERFKSIFEENIKELRESGKADFAERTLTHVALILTPARLLHNKLKMPLSFNELTEQVILNAVEQTKLLKQTDELTVFWQAFAYNVSKGYLTEYKQEYGNGKHAHYRVSFGKHNELKTEAILQLKLNSVYSDYVRFCKNNNLRFLDVASLRKLLTSESYKPFIKSSQNRKGDTTIVKNFGSCYQFFLEKDEDENGVVYLINEVEIKM